MLLALSFSLSANAQPALPSGVSEMELYGTVIRGSKWDIKEIPVCWENLKAQDSKYAVLVRKAVAETWETAAKGASGFRRIGPPAQTVRLAFTCG
ncbi:hypothetical protein [Bradyrhizobium sp. USDA 336]|uniref:hypothetical protein n=1 Tax=Bradyrhizobium sp. USDA 336 TaxID=3156311 RepID=UPI00385097A2